MVAHELIPFYLYSILKAPLAIALCVSGTLLSLPSDKGHCCALQLGDALDLPTQRKSVQGYTAQEDQAFDLKSITFNPCAV